MDSICSRIPSPLHLLLFTGLDIFQVHRSQHGNRRSNDAWRINLRGPCSYFVFFRLHGTQ